MYSSKQIAQKIQNNVKIVRNNSFQVYFFHPFAQTILLFIGQSLIYYIYQSSKHPGKSQFLTQLNKIINNQQQQQHQKPDAPLINILYPTLLDILSSIFSNFALNLIDGSIWQMTRGGQIITTAFLSKILLQRIFTNRQIYGCFLAFIGITLVQIISIITQKGQTQKLNHPILGLFLLFFALMSNSLSLIVQKNIFNNYSIQPLKIVYIQGFMGTTIMIVIAFLFQYVQCPWSQLSQCVCLQKNQCYLQNFIMFFNGFISNFTIFILVALYIITIVITTPIGAILSKEVSPVARSMANISRIIIIWIVNLTITFTLNDDHYQLQSRNIWVNLSKLVGFMLLALGMIVYLTKQSVKQNLSNLLNKKQNKEVMLQQKQMRTFNLKQKQNDQI